MKITERRARRIFRRRQRGYVLISVFGVLTLLSVAALTHTNRSTESLRTANRQATEVKTTHLCEAGVQEVLRTLWRPFKISQSFAVLDDMCGDATAEDPKSPVSGTIVGVGKYSSAVIGYSQPTDNPYARTVTIRSVGWMDLNGNNILESDEPRKTVDVTGQFQLNRSKVFDYTYFVNNYGWMDGFAPDQLIINGDMRANGNFSFLNGSPTVNGSVFAAVNEKLDPPAIGTINQGPVKWSDATYASNYNNDSTPYADRWRQPYEAEIHGAKGTSTYENNRDFVYESTGGVIGNKPYGALMADSNGYKSWTRSPSDGEATYSVIDTSQTDELIMPDLSDLNHYKNVSKDYRDTKAVFADGALNPGYLQGAYIEIYDESLKGGKGGYRKITTNGVIEGSVVIMGTEENPIRIHGPVTVTEDCVIKGYVAGQGTIYTGRNTHIVGSIRYSSQNLEGAEVGTPTFKGASPSAVDAANEKRGLLALAARGSVMMGNPNTFTDSYPLYYMRPPFTKGRYDENGNYIPPFDAKQIDYTGRMRYQSTIPDATINACSESVNVLDCIIYTNFVGGGNIGTAGQGVVFNGTVISRDEAMVVWSLPMRMNYDNRVRERSVSRTPLIDIQLPRSPVMVRSSWQDYGFMMPKKGHAIEVIGSNASNVIKNQKNYNDNRRWKDVEDTVDSVLP